MINEKELLSQFIFTILTDNKVNIDNDIIDKLADGLIARGYGRIDKFAKWLETKSFIGFLNISKLDVLLKEYKNDNT